MDNKDVAKAFSENAETYKKAMKMTGSVAKYGISFLPPMDASSVVLDNASGPGVCTWTVVDNFKGSKEDLPRIYGTDLAPGMVKLFSETIKERVLEDKITAKEMNAGDLNGFEDATFTHSLLNMAIMVDDVLALKIIKEIYRTLRPGGSAMVSSWQRSAGEVVDAVSLRIRPDKEPFRPMNPEWTKKEKLVDMLVAGGFDKDNIEVHLENFNMQFDSEEERWGYMQTPFWAIWRKGWTAEEEAQWGDVMREELVKAWGHGGTAEGAAWVAIAKK